MHVAVLGAGAWGTAIARALAGRARVQLWARDPALLAQVASTRENTRYLPGVCLPEPVSLQPDLDAALAHARGDPEGRGLVLIATPTAALREMAGALRPHAGHLACAWLCKGFERGTGLLAHEVVAEVAPGLQCGPLSGPSFAEEAARDLPTALVIAGPDALCQQVTAALHGGALRIYSSPDIPGVEVGGAVKNVMAIATGISDALELGANARAALITRGLSETQRLGLALGAQADTFLGLAGVGDLLLTCTGSLSRNRRVGLALGAGEDLATVVAGLGHVAEGVWSAPAVLARAHACGVEMPITEAVCDVLAGRCRPREGLARLLAREPRREAS